MMIESARQDLVVENHWGRFHAVLAAKFPDNGAVILVQAVDIAIGRRKVNAIVANRRLARPGGAAPGILVQAAAHELSLHVPNDLQLAVLPGTGAIKVSFWVTQPKWKSGWRFWFCDRSGRCFGHCFAGAARKQRHHGTY